MSKNTKQIYDANPTTTLQDNSLIYLMESPYTPGTDSAIKTQDIFPANGAVADGDITAFSGTSGKKLKKASTITSGQGGTGVASPTAHTIPIAEGPSNYNFIGPLTDGKLLGGVTGADPKAFSALPGTNMDSITVNAGAGTLTFNAANKAITPYVVSQNGSTGYSSIQSASDAANAAGGGAVYVTPGPIPYTEDLTLYDKVPIIGTIPIETLVNDPVSTIKIVGTHTPPTSGFHTFSDLLLDSPTAIYSSSAAGTASLSLLDCNVMITDGYAFDLPNWTGPLYANSLGESSSNSGFVNNATGSSSVTVHDAHIGSFSSSKPMLIPGSANFIRTEIRCPVSTAGLFNLYFCNILDALTFNNGCTALIYFSILTKFGAPVINNNSSGGGGHIISMSTFNGFNNPIIGGTGTDAILIQGTTFFGTSNISGSFSVIYKPWTVPFGGTGISSATANGVILGGTTSTNAFQVADPGLSGQVFTSNGPSSPPTFQVNGSGSGDVVGPVSSTTNAISRYADTTGKLIADSSVTIDNSGNVVANAGNISTVRSASGTAVVNQIYNTSNTSNSDAVQDIVVQGTSAGNAYSLYQIAASTTFTAGFHNSTSSYKICASASFGTNSCLIIGADGTTSITFGNFNVGRSANGSNVASIVQNTSNTASSDAHFEAIVQGTSSGNPLTLYTVMGGATFSAGIHTAGGQNYKISLGGIPGTNDVFIINSSGDTYLTYGQLFITRNFSGGDVVTQIQNGSNTASSNARHYINVGGANAGNPTTSYIINGVSAWTVGIDNANNDNYTISPSISLASPAFVIGLAGSVSIPMGDLTVSRSNSGSAVAIELINSSNTANSTAEIQLQVAGVSSGDPFHNYSIVGGATWSSGADTSDSGKYKISNSTALGTNDAFIITTAGQITKPLQSSFSAIADSNVPSVTGEGTLYNVIFNTPLQNINSNYNVSTGIYTAPISGWYDFSSCVLTGGNIPANTLGEIFLLAGGNLYLGSEFNPGLVTSGGGPCTYMISRKVYLTASQTAQIQISVSGNIAKNISIGGAPTPNIDVHFSGVLVH